MKFEEDLCFGEQGEAIVKKYFLTRNYECNKVDYRKFDYDLLVKKNGKELRVEVKTLRPRSDCDTLLLELWKDFNKTKRPHHFRSCDVLIMINYTEALAHAFKCDEDFWTFLEEQPKELAYLRDWSVEDGRRCQKFMWPNKKGQEKYLPNFLGSFKFSV